MKKINTKAFTLIELLVVITIIGILATGAVNVFTTQLQWARDSTRISDMKVTENAVQQYHADNDEYPTDSDSWSFLSSIRKYVSKDIKDPKKWKTVCIKDDTLRNAVCEWMYKVGLDPFGLAKNAYKLSVRFEKDWNKAKMADDWDNSGDWKFLFDTYGWGTWTTISTPTMVMY